MKRIILIAAFGMLGGCVNGYNQFYRPNPAMPPDYVAATRVRPPPPVPALAESGATPKDTSAQYAREGYAVIGYSAFSSGHNETEKEALEQGAKVGADLVVVMNPQFAGSRTTSIPLTVPTSQTSYSSGSATAYGSGGSATIFGNSTTTTYGSRTDFIPITVNRYNYGALYFVKQKFSFGAFFRDLTDSERQQLQTNRGIYVLQVVNGSPAFDSDVLPGDVILNINGQQPDGAKAAIQLLQSLKGQTITVTLERSSQHIQKTITLGE